MVQGIHSFSCNMIFMILANRSFHTLSRRFVGLNNASVFCLALLFILTYLPVLFTMSLARHRSWHGNLQLSTCILHDIVEFFIIWSNEINTTQFSCIVEHRFFDSPKLWPQSVWSGCRLFSCQPLSGPCISIRWLFIQYGESCFFLSKDQTSLESHQCSNSHQCASLA